MARYILSIHQRTSGTKAVVFDRKANIVAAAYGAVERHFPQPGWVEQEANEIWDVSMQAVAEAFKNGRISPEDIDAIGIANQRDTTVFWNKYTGEPVGRAIVWQDLRTLSICAQLSAKDKQGIEQRTGMIIVPDDTATRIRWLMDNDSVIQRGIARGELICGTIDSWLIWKLSGGAAHVTDHSNASVTLLLNARTLTYDDWMLEELGIPRAILPEVRRSSEIYAYTSPDTFFGVRTPIAGAAGDQQIAVFGQACLQPGMLKNTYSTGSFMILNTGSKYHPPASGLFSPVLWTVDQEVVYGLEGKADVSGDAIQWLQEGLGIIREIGEAEGLASQVPDTQGVFFVPAISGLGATRTDNYARSALIGITRNTARHHVARAALEAMAYQTRDFYETIKQVSGYAPEVLRADGPRAPSDFLLQFQADILGIPVERPVITDTAALGASYLAGLAVGYWQSFEEIAANWRIECRFWPRISEDRRQELYHGWKQMTRQAAEWFQQ